jgi:hypothetical protein
MQMMQKIEQNMQNNIQKAANKDLVIEKRRLVSSQEKRFSAIKVSKLPENPGNISKSKV